MYSCFVVIRHPSDSRVEEACDRVSAFASRLGRPPMRFSVEAPDELNEDYFARAHTEVRNEQFIRFVSECFREQYCEIRVVFKKKAYNLIEGQVEGNRWGTTVSGRLQEVFPISKALNDLAQARDEEEPEVQDDLVPVKTKPTKYAHLRLVE